MLTGGLANTAFIGLPMIETFYGAEYLGIGIVIDQAGSYFVLSTLGILVASIYSSGYAVDAKTVIRRIALFVFFPGICAGARFDAFRVPSLARRAFETPGRDADTACAVSVGYQLRHRGGLESLTSKSHEFRFRRHARCSTGEELGWLRSSLLV
jgi:malate permease and related proteins